MALETGAVVGTMELDTTPLQRSLSKAEREAARAAERIRRETEKQLKAAERAAERQAAVVRRETERRLRLNETERRRNAAAEARGWKVLERARITAEREERQRQQAAERERWAAVRNQQARDVRIERSRIATIRKENARLTAEMREQDRAQRRRGEELARLYRRDEVRVRQHTQAVIDASGRVAFAGVAILAASGFLVKFATDVQESENLFQVSMGKTADEARAWSENYGRSMGRNRYEVRRTMGVFNLMTSSMGASAGEALVMSKNLTRLTNDIASLYNLDPEEAFVKIQAGLAGEVEPLRRLGIVISEATVRQYLQTEGLIKHGQVLSEQQKVTGRYMLMMQQTSEAQGDWARTIYNTANQLRIARSLTAENAAVTGKSLVPATNALLKAYIGLQMSYGELAEEHPRIVSGFMNTAAGLSAIGVAAGGSLWAVSKLRRGLESLGWTKAAGAVPWVGGITAGIGAALMVPAIIDSVGQQRLFDTRVTNERNSQALNAIRSNVKVLGELRGLGVNRTELQTQRMESIEKSIRQALTDMRYSGGAIDRYLQNPETIPDIVAQGERERLTGSLGNFRQKETRATSLLGYGAAGGVGPIIALAGWAYDALNKPTENVREFTRALEDLNTTTRDWSMLKAKFTNQGLTPTELAEKLGGMNILTDSKIREQIAEYQGFVAELQKAGGNASAIRTLQENIRKLNDLLSGEARFAAAGVPTTVALSRVREELSSLYQIAGQRRDFPALLELERKLRDVEKAADSTAAILAFVGVEGRADAERRLADIEWALTSAGGAMTTSTRRRLNDEATQIRADLAGNVQDSHRFLYADVAATRRLQNSAELRRLGIMTNARGEMVAVPRTEFQSTQAARMYQEVNDAAAVHLGLVRDIDQAWKLALAETLEPLTDELRLQRDLVAAQQATISGWSGAADEFLNTLFDIEQPAITSMKRMTEAVRQLMDGLFRSVLQSYIRMASDMMAYRLFSATFGGGWMPASDPGYFNPGTQFTVPDYAPTSGFGSGGYSFGKRVAGGDVEVRITNTGGSPVGVSSAHARRVGGKLVIEAVLTELQSNPAARAALTNAMRG